MKQILGLSVILFVFYSSQAQTYCAPTFSSGCSSWKTQAMTIDAYTWTAPTSCTTWDFTNTILNATQNVPINFSVTNGNWCGVSVWIDTNSDGDFDDAGENFYSLYANTTSVYTYNFSITVPASVPNGLYRMRVISSWGSNGTSSSNGTGGCGAYQYGNYQDFTLQLGALPPCAAPGSITTSAITTTSATVSWGAVSGAVGYQYDISTTFNNPVSGTPTTNTSVNANPLSPGTTYYTHIRTDCGGNNFSPWIVDSFTTVAPCAAPVSVQANNVTATSATFSWSGSSATVGYEYDLSMSATPPSNGTPTSGPPYSVGSLTPNTNYYFHVRSDCSNNNWSPWTTINLMTADTCYPPTGLTISGITSTTATANWNAVSGALSYEYDYSTSSTPPAAGITTTALSYNMTSLLPGTMYYFHLRALCSGFSIWNSQPFTTSPDGLNDLGLSGIKIVPNPTRGHVFLEKGDSRTVLLSIYNSTGQIVYSDEISLLQTEIDLNFLQNGLYFLYLEDKGVRYFDKLMMIR